MQRNNRKYFQTAHVSGFKEVIFFNTRKKKPLHRVGLVWVSLQSVHIQQQLRQCRVNRRNIPANTDAIHWPSQAGHSIICQWTKFSIKIKLNKEKQNEKQRVGVWVSFLFVLFFFLTLRLLFEKISCTHLDTDENN